MYENFAMTLPEETKCLLICDRGALDNKAYIDAEGFAQILKESVVFPAHGPPVNTIFVILLMIPSSSYSY